MIGKIAWVVVIGCFLITGCSATVGTRGIVKVPTDAAMTCEQHCESIGLTLGAVAIMANNVGCICQNNNGNTDQAASTAAGMVTLMVQEQQRQAQQANNM